MKIDFIILLEEWFYLATMIVCFIGIIGELIHSIIKMQHKRKVAGYNDRERFSMVTVIYIIFMYGIFLIWWMRSYIQQFFQFTFYTWVGNMMFYCLTSAGILYMGVCNLANVAFLHERGKAQEIKRIWIVLKIGMIPFYLINVVHYLWELKVPEEMYWTSIFSCIFFIGSAPFMVLMFPCVLIFLNGCIGWYYIYHLRKMRKMAKHLFVIHCVLQGFPVLDLISMAVILKKYKCLPEIREEVIAEEILTEESAIQVKERKREKKIGAAIYLLFILLSIVIYFWPLWKDVIIREPTVYEMTEEEKRLLKNLHMRGNYRTIDGGELSQIQVYELEIIRYANHVIEEKYPDIQFRICSAQNVDDGYKFYIKEESNDEFFEMDVYDDKGLTEQDNLYVFFCGEAYNEYLEEQLKGKIAGLAEIECVFWKVVDGERSANVSIENILDGESDAIPGQIILSISAKGKSEEECKNQEKLIKEAVRQLQIPTNFWVYFWDETEQEIWSEKKEKEQIYLFWIQEGE